MIDTAHVIRDIALRLVALIAVDLGLGLILSQTGEPNDANIGAGLLVLLAIAIFSGFGGLYDGRRVGFRGALIIWAPTAVLATVAIIALIDPISSPFDGDVFLSDLQDLGAFMVALVGVPALLGGALSSLLRPRASNFSRSGS